MILSASLSRKDFIATSSISVLSLTSSHPGKAEDIHNTRDIHPTKNINQRITVFIIGGFLISAKHYTSFKTSFERQTCVKEVKFFESYKNQNLKNENSTAKSTMNEQISWLMKEISPQDIDKGKILLVGHSKGCQLAAFVGERILQQGGNLLGIVMIDPVDDPTKKDSCFKALDSIADKQPILIIALPFSGPMNKYYKSKPKNLCSPTGSDAFAFYSSLVSCTSGFPLVTLCCLEEAGHLQILDGREELSIGNVCGVSDVETDQTVQLTVCKLILKWFELVICSSHDNAMQLSTTLPSKKEGISKKVDIIETLITQQSEWNYLVDSTKISWKQPTGKQALSFDAR